MKLYIIHKIIQRGIEINCSMFRKHQKLYFYIKLSNLLICVVNNAKTNIHILVIAKLKIISFKVEKSLFSLFVLH